MKKTFSNLALWLTFLLALISSMSHVAWTFSTLERPGQEWAGWLAAIAVDCGLASLAYAIQQRRRLNRRSTMSLWAGVIVLTSISAYANVIHALSVSGDLFRAVILSVTLPLLVVYMGEIVSSNDVAEAERIEREIAKVEAKAERELAKQERLEAERQRELADAERLRAEQERTEAAGIRYSCEQCPQTFASQNALNAHRRAHANGHAVESATVAK